MTLASLHTVLGWMVVAANGFVGVWALAAHWVDAMRSRLLWTATAAAQVALGAQVVLGVVFQQTSGRQAPGIHQFYGFLTLISVAILYSYRFQIPKWRYLLYGFGGLFIMGLALRAVILPAA